MARGLKEVRVKNIYKELTLMASLVEKQIYESMMVLKKYDLERIEKTIKNDDEVDLMNKIIEDKCIKFIATEQPLAKDLRRIFGASKIVTDLERMADHAVDICKIIRKIGKSPNVFDDDCSALWEMDEKVRKMIIESVDAYIAHDEERAYEICAEDDKVDEMYKELFTRTIEIIKTQGQYANDGAQLLFIIKYLERIADHVTNICEWTIFSKQGIYVDLNE